MPDIDLDFPRDIRERLILPRPRALRPRTAALVCAFAGTACAARSGTSARRWLPRVRSSGSPIADVYRGATSSSATSPRRSGPRRLVALALGGPARPRGLGLPRHISQHPGGMVLRPAADRPLSGPAGGDGGAQDRPVGQGLVRRRRFSEDRPARARNAVGGRRCVESDRRRAASASTSRRSSTIARPSRRFVQRRPPGCSRSRAGRRCRCCRAAAGDDRRRDRPGGAGAPGPIQGAPCTPSERRRLLRRTPITRSPTTRASFDPLRHARGDRLPGPGDPGRWHSRASPGRRRDFGGR